MFFNKDFNFKNSILFLSLAVPLVYLIGIMLLSLLSSIDFNEVILYKYIPIRYAQALWVDYLIKPLVVISGFLLIFCFPGILFASVFVKKKSSFSLVKFFSLGFALNVLLLFLGTSLLKIFGIVLNRFWFITVILVLTLVGIYLFFRSNLSFLEEEFMSKYKNDFYYFILFFAIIISFVGFFHNPALRPLPVNFDYTEETILNSVPTTIGDPQEEFGIAFHLKKRLLPYWLINNLNRFGVYLYDPHLSYFFNLHAVVLFGESYAALNLLFLSFIPLIFLFTNKIMCIGEDSTKRPLVYFGTTFFILGFLWLSMNSARRPDLPFMSWPENSLWDPIESLWVFLIIGTIFFLLKKDVVFAFIYSSLATLCRYESMPCIFILAAVHYYVFKKDRVFSVRFVKSYLIFAILFILSLFIVCIFQEKGTEYLRFLVYEKVFIKVDLLRTRFNLHLPSEKIWPCFSMSNTWEFIKVSLLCTCFFIVLFLLPSRDKIMNFISIFGIIYFLSVVLQSHKLVTYGFLLIPLAAVNLKRYIYPATKIKLFNLLLYLIIWSIGAAYLL